MTRKGLIWTATIGIAMIPSMASADFFFHSWNLHRENPKEFSLIPEGSYYSSTSNYDTAGQILPPPGLERYSRVQTDVTLAYGLNRYLTLFGRTSWTRAQVNHSTLGADAFGFADQTVGLGIHAFELRVGKSVAPISFDFQLQADFPGYSNSTTANEGRLFLGDGSSDFTGGAFASWAFYSGQESMGSLIAGAGYTYRTSGFSAAIPWSAEVKLSPKNQGLILSAALAGILSLNTDTSTGTLVQGAGGSLAVNAINPSLLTLKGQLGYQVNPKIALVAQATQTLAGQSAPAGFSMGLGIQTHLGLPVSKNPALLTPKEYGKSNQGFVNYGFEAKISRVNDRMNLVKIDKGSQNGVEVNQVFDVFQVKPDGSMGDVIARAKCVSIKPEEAALTVTEYFKEIWIEEGFIAKRPLPQ